MKDNLFEMLLNLFEKTLSQLKKEHASVNKADVDPSTLVDDKTSLQSDLAFIRSKSYDAIRVFTQDEQMKLTKASYQFLMRLSSLGIISSDVLELVINQLVLSESRFVTLQETKWTIRSILATNLDAQQLAFLDLVLYHKEDALSLH